MNNHPDKTAEIRTKLREGLDLLANSSEEDIAGLNGALIKIHGAMEDFVRLEIARKAPELRSLVQDAGQTHWKSLLDYSRQVLGFTFDDTQMISTANHYRQEVAHGGNYEGSRFDLVRYAEFVHRKCYPGRPVPDLAYRKPAPVPATSPRASVATVPASNRSRTHRNPAGKPWYRSTAFLVLSFFLLPPVWVLLILTDRRQSCFAKGTAYVLVLLMLGSLIVLFPSANVSPNVLQTFLQQAASLLTPQAVQASEPDAVIPATPENTPPLTDGFSGTKPACVIVWVEHSSELLAAKNRSMVWEEIVMENVRGSGMTDRQFYDLVVEKNPTLVKDGYEFKKGKTYLLPECQ